MFNLVYFNCANPRNWMETGELLDRDTARVWCGLEISSVWWNKRDRPSGIHKLTKSREPIRLRPSANREKKLSRLVYIVGQFSSAIHRFLPTAKANDKITSTINRTSLPDWTPIVFPCVRKAEIPGQPRIVRSCTEITVGQMSSDFERDKRKGEGWGIGNGGKIPGQW